MGIRYFCDVCNAEISWQQQADRVRRQLGDVKIEILVSYNGTWDGGQICHACVLRTATEGETVDVAYGYKVHASAERYAKITASISALPQNDAMRRPAYSAQMVDVDK